MAALTLADPGPPLAVWDTGEADGLFLRNWAECGRWARAHIARASDAYRAEFYLIDAPFARLYCFALDDRGRTFVSPVTGEVAMEAEPVVQALDELPPAHLMGQ